MSNWQNNILHHTETPPTGVWDNIANALDNDQNQLSEKLQQLETPPPSGIWDKIAHQLNEPDGLQQKIEAFEIIPPIGNWDTIALKLEKEDTNWVERINQHEEVPPATNWNAIEHELNPSNNLADKLHNYTVEPPVGSWDTINDDLYNHQHWVSKLARHAEPPPKNVWPKIDAQLNNVEKEDKKPTATIISFRYKMAAAAAVLIGIVLSVVLLNKKEDIQVASSSKSSIDQPILPKQPIPNTITNAETIPSNSSIATIKVNTGKTKKAATLNNFDIDTNYTKSLVFTSEASQTVSNPANQLLVKLKNAAGQELNDMAMLNAPNNYINVTGPNGDPIKVSAKFSKMVNLIKERDTSKEEYIDVIIKEGAIWKSKFRHWREKMNNSNITPTPANFMDIIELSKMVKDNK